MSTGGGGGELSLPLSLEIVGTDRSRDDNEGAVSESGVVGGEHKTRAVASLKTRMRVVTSNEVLGSGGSMGGLYVQVALPSARREL